MRKEIIINSSPHEIRIAMLEDGELVELLVESADAKRIVGNVYKGKVTSVKPGLQAAFVDIGLERAGFLHASDLEHDDSDEDGPESAAPAPSGGGRGGPPGRRRQRHVPDIGTVLKVGDQILVQVTKEPISTKGPRLTADISLPGRYLVMMPKGRHIGVSRKIEDRRERVRLKQLLQSHRPAEGAFIIRTAATAVTEEGGTGTEAAVAGFRVAGKTATAQKADPATGKYSPDKFTASFVGFLPADKPRLVIAIVLDEPVIGHYGGDLADTVVKPIATSTMAPMPPPTAPNANAITVAVPDVTGMAARDAVKAMLAAGLVPQVEGSGRAARISPGAGAVVPKGSTVRVTFGPT